MASDYSNESVSFKQLKSRQCSPPARLLHEDEEKMKIVSLRKNRKRKRRLLTALVLLFFIINLQQVTSSRRFLTGLIIGFLLTKNGAQPGPAYPLPAPSYSGGSHGPQQPLFIIIPSAPGKPSYRSTSTNYATPQVSYTDAYQHHPHSGHHEHSGRRMSLARRLGRVKRRHPKPLQTSTYQGDQYPIVTGLQPPMPLSQKQPPYTMPATMVLAAGSAEEEEVSAMRQKKNKNSTVPHGYSISTI